MIHEKLNDTVDIISDTRFKSWVYFLETYVKPFLETYIVIVVKINNKNTEKREAVDSAASNY